MKGQLRITRPEVRKQAPSPGLQQEVMAYVRSSDRGRSPFTPMELSVVFCCDVSSLIQRLLAKGLIRRVGHGKYRPARFGERKV